MISVTPIGRLTYANQDFDEQSALLTDLKENPRDYLAHPDPAVRSCADWTMELWGLRTLRPGYRQRAIAGEGERELARLYKRLRELAK